MHAATSAYRCRAALLRGGIGIHRGLQHVTNKLLITRRVFPTGVAWKQARLYRFPYGSVKHFVGYGCFHDPPPSFDTPDYSTYSVNKLCDVTMKQMPFITAVSHFLHIPTTSRFGCRQFPLQITCRAKIVRRINSRIASSPIYMARLTTATGV